MPIWQRGTRLLTEQRAALRAFRTFAATAGIRPALASLCDNAADHLGVPRPRWLGTGASIPPGLLDDELLSPELMGQAFEVAMNPGRRKRSGAHYTPPAAAAGLVRATVDVHQGSVGQACDPTVGGGVFLLEVLRWHVRNGVAANVAAETLWGADLDPLAVDVARSVIELEVGAPVDGIAERIVVGDTLVGNPWGSAPPFDLVIGNPPFLGQLRTETVRTEADNAALAEKLDVELAPYAETALAFMVRGLQLADGGATVAMIQPQSILSNRDTATLRRAALDRSHLAGLWFSVEPVFDASVRVCAPILTRRARAPQAVQRWSGPMVEPAAPSPGTFVDENWGALALDLLGVPAVELDGTRTVGDLASVTAGFRDEFYGVCGVAAEDGAEASHPIMTSGLIEPLRSLWGERAAKLSGTVYDAPVLPESRLDDLDSGVRRWVDARLVPKLLVATQTKVIEVVVDPDGELVPLTPVLSVEPHPRDLALLAATLSSPPVCAWAARRTVGAALSVDAVKLSARQVRAIPLPEPSAALERAITLLDGLRGGFDRAAWQMFGVQMCKAFAVDPAEVVPWWLDRMRWSDQGSGS